MRRKTYAHNSVIIGVLLGILVYASTENVVLGIVTFVGVSVVGFILIRALEKLLYKGADKAEEAIKNKIASKKAEKENNDNNE